MATVKVKERVFAPSGHMLGSFRPVDFTKVMMRFQETADEDGKSPDGPSNIKNDVPNSADSKQSSEEDPEDPYTGNLDPYGNDIDDDDPLQQKGDNGSSGSGDSSSQSSGESSDGGGDESGDGSDSNVDGSDSQGDGSDSGDDTSNGDSMSGNDLGSGNDGDQANGDQNDGNSDGQSGSSSGSGLDPEDSSTMDSGDEKQNGEKADTNHVSSAEVSDRESQGEGDSTNGNSQSGKGNSKGKKTSFDEKSDGFDPRDDFSGWSDSDIKKALDELNDGQTDIDKEMDSMNDDTEDKDSTQNNKRDNRIQRDNTQSSKEEKRALKEALSKAVRDSNASRSDDESSIENSISRDVEDQVLSSIGVGNFTSLFNPKTSADWKRNLERVLDEALGFDIYTNPNLFNKKIEDAPPGREDEFPEIKNVLVLLDCSASMGSGKFVQVIDHLDTMMRVRNMSKTWFHIIDWGTTSVPELLDTYKKVKGSMFRREIRQHKEKRWNTYFVPALVVASQKVPKPEAIIIMTDGEIHDDISGSGPDVDIARKYLKKHRKKIIWALTHNGDVYKVSKFDPTAKAMKRIIKFKK